MQQIKSLKNTVKENDNDENIYIIYIHICMSQAQKSGYGIDEMVHA